MTDPVRSPQPRAPGPAPAPACRAAAVEVPAAVVARLQDRDPEALAAVIDCYGDRVYQTCRRITGSHDDAEDAVQEVFLRVFDQASKFRGDCRFGSWLLRVAVNHTINLCRSARRRRAQPLHEVEAAPAGLTAGDPAPLQSVAEREELEHLDAALQSLPLEQRTVVVLRDLEGLSYGEIATLLDLPPGTVNSRIVRGRQRLLEILRHRLPRSFAEPTG